MNFLTDCLFVGVEVEGDSPGNMTLFVADLNVTRDQIEKAAREYKVDNIYFGAGKTRRLPYSISFEDLRELGEEWCITFETNDPESLTQQEAAELGNVCLIFVMPMTFMPDAIKIDFEDCTNVGYLDVYRTSFSDPLYHLDKKIE